MSILSQKIIVIIPATRKFYLFYNDLTTEVLTSFPGNLVVYYYHFAVLPVHLSERYLQITAHDELRDHLKRNMGRFFTGLEHNEHSEAQETNHATLKKPVV